MWPFTTQSTAYTSDDVVESGAPVSAFENRAGQRKASADGMGGGKYNGRGTARQEDTAMEKY